VPLDLADLPSATKIPAREPVGTCRSDAQVIRVNCCGGCHAAFAVAVVAGHQSARNRIGRNIFRHSDLNPRREGSDIGIMTPSPTTNLASCDCAPLSRDYAATFVFGVSLQAVSTVRKHIAGARFDTRFSVVQQPHAALHVVAKRTSVN